MEKREQDIVEKIKKKTEYVEIPDTLSPERIGQKLEKEEKQRKRLKKQVFDHWKGLAAACILLAAGIGGYTFFQPGSSGEYVESERETTGSYEEIYAYIDAYRNNAGGAKKIFTKDTEILYESSTGAESSLAKEGSALTDGNYSQTNLRQEGVDEGDVVKTDGRYLYVCKENGRQIKIIDTVGELREIGQITAEEGMQIRELYLFTGQTGTDTVKLVCAGNKTSENDGTSTAEIATYDVSNPKKPQMLGTVSQSGGYTSSRLVGGHLYLFSEYYVYGQIREEEPFTYIPAVNGKLIQERDIVLPPYDTGCMYEIVTSVDLDRPSQVSDSKAIFTNGGTLYVSNKNIYYYETDWGTTGGREKTVIRKIGYEDGVLSKAVKGETDGYVKDSFCIDEYKGYLRIVSTVGETNSVYVLDSKLKTVGAIRGLAKDERIYSARFLGDMGYFVTFRETDPLFCADFKDPENPKIIGKLKIPGFSDYLHPYGKNRLLGIGMSIEEDSQVTDGAKLSMFDISDGADVKEENTYVMKNVFSTTASSEYKSVLVDEKKNLIGVSGYTNDGICYYLFTYDEKEGFQCKLSEEVNGASAYCPRGIYIEDTLYVINGNIIEAYSLMSYKKTDDIIL